jgi:hypothetical protein
LAAISSRVFNAFAIAIARSTRFSGDILPMKAK